MDFSALSGIGLFLLYFVASLALLAIFTRLYVATTPFDEGQEIAQGHVAPAIALGGAMLGFTFPLLVASYAHSGIFDFLAWSLISGLVQLAAFQGLHRLMPRALETNNVAGAVCFASGSVCIGLINAASFLG